jgi:hypothetical protein
MSTPIFAIVYSLPPSHSAARGEARGFLDPDTKTDFGQGPRSHDFDISFARMGKMCYVETMVATIRSVGRRGRFKLWILKNP